jgi:quercetin dioxygenase-like cupin family protein
MTEIRYCSDLDKEMESLLADGYCLDMITPADAPREIQLSKNKKIVRLVSDKNGSYVSAAPENRPVVEATPPLLRKEGGFWTKGRAGMMYRDLIAGRLGGKLIASHIRLTEGGPVPDYVHYHKIDFQLIYCLRGRIKVVYEDQGEPFWLEPGDCVLQPPEVRHRVLECEGGSEVLELSSPAEHETWIEHDMSLPTKVSRPDRLFSGQGFVRSIASDAIWQQSAHDGFEERETGILEATNGLADVRVRRSTGSNAASAFNPRPGVISVGFVVAGRENGVAAISDELIAPATEVLWLELKDIAHVNNAVH